MKLNEALEAAKLNEGLQYIKFRYNGKDRTIKHPKVKLLDPFYKGRPGQKTYGQRDDLLGWSLSHVKNKRYALKALDAITDFASLLGANTHEVYKRLKYFYPPQAKFIRRYIRKDMKGLREKRPHGLWKRISFDDLIKFKSY